MRIDIDGQDRPPLKDSDTIMQRPIQYTATPRQTQWRDLSDQHRSVRERLASSLQRFAEGQGAPVPSIVGAYGSGKSELMAWGFRHCWCELGIPAFVLNAENLLKQLPPTMSPAQFADEVGGFVQNQLSRLGDQLEDTDSEGFHLATDMRRGESALTYLRELFGDGELSAESIRAMLDTGRGVLFIDEIEQQYGELLNRVEANDRAPLREMLQRLGNGQESYYVALSFGLTSAYEAIGGADARRMDTLTLPIPEPKQLGQFANLDGYGNFLWWTSRGRPGWAAKLANDWGSGIADARTLEQLRDLQPSSLENLPLIDVSSLPDALRSQRVNELLTQLIKRLRPIAWSELIFTVERTERDILPHYLVTTVRTEDELTSVATLVDSFLDDLIGLADRLNVTNPDFAQLRRYLTRILSSMADAKQRVVFGGPRKMEFLARGIIAPTLILVQDLILEFEGDQEGTLVVLNLLDKVMKHVGIVGEHVRDDYDLVREFPQVEERFVETRDLTGESWVALAPKGVETLYPRLIGRPLVALLPNTKPTLDEQRAALEAAVTNQALRLHALIQYEHITVEFIFVPNVSCLPTIQETYFNRNRRRHYLVDNRVFVLIDLADRDQGHLIREMYGDDIRVLEELQKLQTAVLPEKRLRDFLASLWHNLLQTDLAGEETISLQDALHILHMEASPTKSDKRKLEYYQQRVEQTLEALSITAARAYQVSQRRLFLVGQPDFPEKRIDDALDGVKDSRTIEQIGLAFDLVEDYAVTVEGLTNLRALDRLRRLTMPPSAYNEFLVSYTVTTRPKELSTSLAEVFNYIQVNAGFDGLRNIAERLGLQPPQNFDSANDATEDTPLLHLFGHLTSAEKAFLKAVTFYAYIHDNQREYRQLLEESASDVKQIRARLAHLHGRVQDFNCELDFELLDLTEIEALQAEVDKLTDHLAHSDEFTPMLTYVSYRFAASVASELQKKQQRWSSEHGIEGWRTQLRDLRGWRKDVLGLDEEISDLFSVHQELKAAFLGTPSEILTRLGRQLEDGARQVFDEMQTGNDLESVQQRNRGNAEPYANAKTDVREQIDALRRAACAIDALLDEIDSLHDGVISAIDKLGESHGG